MRSVCATVRRPHYLFDDFAELFSDSLPRIFLFDKPPCVGSEPSAFSGRRKKLFARGNALARRLRDAQMRTVAGTDSGMPSGVVTIAVPSAIASNNLF